MKEYNREFLKAITAIVVIVIAVVLLCMLWTSIDPNSPGIRAMTPETRHENGYKIVTIGGVDYISTDDGNGGERLTPMIKKETPE